MERFERYHVNQICFLCLCHTKLFMIQRNAYTKCFVNISKTGYAAYLVRIQICFECCNILPGKKVTIRNLNKLLLILVDVVETRMFDAFFLWLHGKPLCSQTLLFWRAIIYYPYCWQRFCNKICLTLSLNTNFPGSTPIQEIFYWIYIIICLELLQ